VLWALVLRSSRPDVYARIGRGAESSTVLSSARPDEPSPAGAPR
jgi:hypothetical protein